MQCFWDQYDLGLVYWLRNLDLLFWILTASSRNENLQVLHQRFNKVVLACTDWDTLEISGALNHFTNPRLDCPKSKNCIIYSQKGLKWSKKLRYPTPEISVVRGYGQGHNCPPPAHICIWKIYIAVFRLLWRSRIPRNKLSSAGDWRSWTKYTSEWKILWTPSHFHRRCLQSTKTPNPHVCQKWVCRNVLHL